MIREVCSLTALTRVYYTTIGYNFIEFIMPFDMVPSDMMPSDGRMDDLRFYVLFNSISVISGR